MLVPVYLSLSCLVLEKRKEKVIFINYHNWQVATSFSTFVTNISRNFIKEHDPVSKWIRVWRYLFISCVCTYISIRGEMLKHSMEMNQIAVGKNALCSIDFEFVNY